VPPALVMESHGKLWDLGRPFSRPGKSWKIAKVIKNHGKSWKIMENDDNVMQFFTIALSNSVKVTNYDRQCDTADTVCTGLLTD